MNIAILLCGGSGQRMGDEFKVPKQYLKVNEKHIFSYSLDKLLLNENIDSVIICAENDWREIILECIDSNKDIAFSNPGNTRQMSVYNSLVKAKEISFEKDDLVIIHDGARPIIDDDIINDCLEKCKKYDGAIASIQVNDTIYQTNDGTKISFVPKRDNLRAGQTPEAFKLVKYLEIHNSVTESTINSVTGGAEFAANNGMKVAFSQGKRSNIKITSPKDLIDFKSTFTYE